MNPTPEIIPLKGVRSFIANKMLESLSTSAQVTHHCSVNATALIAEKKRLAESSTKVSIEDLVNFSVIHALKKHPSANGRVEDQEIHLHHSIDLSVAIALPNNQLVAPTIFGAGDMELIELNSARLDLIERAKDNNLTVTEMTGGTFTVSNLGLTRVEHFTPIINLPQICILGIGRMMDYPVRSARSTIELNPHICLSLTFDHRVLNGAPAGNFLTSICEEIEGIGN